MNFRARLVRLLIILVIGALIWLAYNYLNTPRKRLQRDSSVQRGLVYCEYPDEQLKLDFYPGTPQAGVVIYIHGGGWASGSRSPRRKIAYLIDETRQVGLHVASIDYRLMPRHRLPAMLADLDCAIDYLHRQASKLQIDARRIGLLGTSAGGHLALLSTAQRRAQGHQAIRAVAGLFAPTNFLRREQLWPDRNDAFYKKLMNDLTGADDENTLRRASPYFQAEYLNVPTLLVNGDRDDVVTAKQGAEMYQRLTELNQPAEFILVKNRGHLVALPGGSVPDWQQLSEQTARFFAVHLGNQ